MRAFESADVSSVHRLIGETIDACYPALYPPRAVAFFKRLHSRDSISNRAEAGFMVVVEQPTGIIATGALVDGEIGGVFVSPDAQAAGLGARIMDELERIARESGLSFVNLDVSLPSRGFYEHRGYRVLEERSIDVGEGESLEYWRAAKRLAGES